MKNRIVENVVKSNLTYRFDIFLSVLNLILTLTIQISIWRALFINKTNDAESINLPYMISYVIISSFVSLFVNTNVIEKINERIKKGDISIDLIKPISFDYLMFSESCGMILYNLITQISVIILFIICYRKYFVECYFGVFFFVSVIQSMLLYFLISYCIGLVGFWYLEIWHLRRFIDGIIKVFSGAIIPIVFFPEYMSNAIQWMPFRGLYDIPINMALNNTSNPEKIKDIIFQLVWILIFIILKNIIYKNGIRKVEVQGG